MMSREHEDEIKNLIDKISKPENVEALRKIIEVLPEIADTTDLIKEVIESGTLDTLFRIACLINTFRHMITDEMISGFSSLGSSTLELLAKAKSPIIQKGLSSIVDHPIEFEKELNKDQISGIRSLFKLLRDKEFLRGLTIFVAMIKLIGRYWDRVS